jgi:DNA (cytosine-5)-methyltransferase 1
MLCQESHGEPISSPRAAPDQGPDGVKLGGFPHHSPQEPPAATDPLTVGGMFSGIGGLELGLERAGMRTIWQCEIEPYACQVLAEHWPGVPNLGDVAAIDWSSVERPNLICGGFPCQDISRSGLKAGITGSKSSLWKAMAVAVRHLRPDYVLVENVGDLAVRGLDVVLGDLCLLGFDAEWSVLPACAMGAPHTRERMFIVAHPSRGDGPDPLPHRAAEPLSRFEPRGSGGSAWTDWWLSEPPVDRVAHGIPSAMVRRPLERLGNAVVPQVAEWIGHRILEAAHG